MTTAHELVIALLRSAVPRPFSATSEFSLSLGESALRHAGTASDDHVPLHVAVLGPTQVGKSTIVNLMLGSEAAGVSPLAGFTVHAHGFVTPNAHVTESWASRLLPGFTSMGGAELTPDNLAAYSLESVHPGSAVDSLRGCVVWDTPDFDSLAALDYQQAVLEIAALADVHVFVLSKEKYADLSAWRLLKTLEPLGRPLIVCLNKITADAAPVLGQSLRTQLVTAAPRWAGAPIVYVDYATPPLRPDHSAGEHLRRIVSGTLDAERAKSTATRADERQRGVHAFIGAHWDSWTAPIRAEHGAIKAWRAQVASAADELLAAYRRDYLDHPQRYDAFRRATVELLQLLELPGVGGFLTQARQVVTWPIRQLTAAVRDQWSARSGQKRGAGRADSTLSEAFDGFLVTLVRDAARRRDEGGPGRRVWEILSEQLRAGEPQLRTSFAAAAGAVHEQEQRDIHAAANELYQMLQQRPAMLNTLRAARATADVAGIAIAIKTGGAHFNDLLFAPAFFAFTSMLTEGALGSYMIKVAADLKQRQLENVRERLVSGFCVRELGALADHLSGEGLFGISAERLADADAEVHRVAPGGGAD